MNRRLLYAVMAAILICGLPLAVQHPEITEQ